MGEFHEENSNEERLILHIKWHTKHVINTQEYLWEALDEKFFKKLSIDRWLKEVFRMPREQVWKLKNSNIDFNKKVSIQELFEEIKKRTDVSLGTLPIIVLANESLDEQYMNNFCDFLDREGERVSSRISVKDFLWLIYSFEKSKW